MSPPLPCCPRSIRCLRNIIHWNLISAFILRNATWFVVQLTMSPEVHQSNVVCPGGAGPGSEEGLVTAAYNYFHVTNFFWMFGEGCYLHTAIVLTYSTDRLRKWMFICIGWGVPFPIIVAWAIGKLYYDNEKWKAILTFCQGWNWATQILAFGSSPGLAKHCSSLMPLNWTQVTLLLLPLWPSRCWFGKRPGVYTDYIYQGPMILVLLPLARTHAQAIPPCVKLQINFIFLFNIVRILMTKLRASTTSETIQYRHSGDLLQPSPRPGPSHQARGPSPLPGWAVTLGLPRYLPHPRKAVKATLVLLPLLGITYMLFFVNPGEDEVSRVVFIYFNSFLESFQGFFVSVFYCFLNSEVRSAIRKRWHRWQDKHSIRARVARAMSIPTSPTRVSFHSIKQSTAI
ncbi:hypothetical protein J1605_003815 [Eschrichtius robustus]|uniref:G-protein coupled receptors family 2 profile 2 domain-containing protein n=1 Tax=Eschrichtius robustus TaxID=9764 RepID=A0AB34HPY8_ESCRO|nr:hypothetical protein J1605_003815 [Eschrichtius robustus]